ncbi:MAG: capsular polysaccharide synthesis protein [Rikenellaceae bacterium]
MIERLNKIFPQPLRPYLRSKKAQYFNKYIESNFQETLKPYIIAGECREAVSEFKVWVFWAQGFDSAPDLVQMCSHRLMEVCGDQVVHLTMDNIADYVSFPPHIIEKVRDKRITLTHFSDLLRLALLSQYGGLWIDSTCWVSDDCLSTLRSGDLCTLHSAPRILPRYIANGRWTIWAIGSRYAQTTLFSATRDIIYKYWEFNDSMVDYFLIDYTLNYVYEKFDCARVMVDNVRVDASQRNELRKRLNAPYSESQYRDILASTPISKLSYKMPLSERTESGEQTLFGKLKELYR